MKENKKNTLLINEDIELNDTKYFDNSELDYCGFRLSFLANKIKSECLKSKKLELHFINP